jgi:hypothetical protein
MLPKITPTNPDDEYYSPVSDDACCEDLFVYDDPGWNGASIKETCGRNPGKQVKSTVHSHSDPWHRFFNVLLHGPNNYIGEGALHSKETILKDIMLTHYSKVPNYQYKQVY